MAASGVQCYADTSSMGTKVAFAVMVNKFSGTRSEIRKAIEQLLLGL